MNTIVEPTQFYVQMDVEPTKDAIKRFALATFHRYSSKIHQEEAIIEFVSGKDVFVALPTGRIW